jgi:hypothetical protein
MKTSFRVLILLTAFLGPLVTVRAGLLDQIKTTLGTNSSSVAMATGLSEDQIASGLKQALGKGVSNAISSLGQSDGFLTNLTVKIPLPGKLQSVESALRLAGQSKMADDFVASMNHAAEQAVPVAAKVFGDAIQQMSITDAKAILTGTNDAATQYFKRTTQTNLYAKFQPVVQKATDSVGVTAQYKAMMGKFDAANSLGTMFGSKPVVKFSAADIDGYVTQRALDGLFVMVAEEEKNIRANPVARTTDLLQKVFGTGTK